MRVMRKLRDPDLVSCNNELAVAIARHDDLVGRADTGESGETWNTLKATYREAEKQRQLVDLLGEQSMKGQEAKHAFFEAFGTIGSLIDEGVNDYRTWDEINDMAERIRKLAETQSKITMVQEKAIPIAKAQVLFAAISALVKETLPDETELRKFHASLSRLIAQSSARGNGPG
jgi:hypothetical protein